MKIIVEGAPAKRYRFAASEQICHGVLDGGDDHREPEAWRTMAGRCHRPEWLLIYGMMMVACALTTTGLVAYHLPIMVLSFYYATPENDWARVIHPYIPDWMVPKDPVAIKYFFEGLPQGEAFPGGLVPYLLRAGDCSSSRCIW